MTPKEPETLYHYTTAEGLIGIMQSKCLWATNLLYLNDATEWLLGMQRASEKLTALSSKTGDAQQKRRIDWLKDKVDKVRLGRAINTYAVSFSSEGDLLSQWRAYCPGGGFSIGFKKQYLMSIIAKKQLSLAACIYDKASQEAAISDAIRRCSEQWIRQLAPTQWDRQDDDRFLEDGKLIWDLTAVASTFKNELFKEEHEWRIVSKPEHHAAHASFRASGSVVVPYIKINLEPESNSWRGVHIIVGPGRHAEESKASIYKLIVQQFGVAPAIEISHISYRVL